MTSNTTIYSAWFVGRPKEFCLRVFPCFFRTSRGSQAPPQMTYVKVFFIHISSNFCLSLLLPSAFIPIYPDLTHILRTCRSIWSWTFRVRMHNTNNLSSTYNTYIRAKCRPLSSDIYTRMVCTDSQSGKSIASFVKTLRVVGIQTLLAKRVRCALCTNLVIQFVTLTLCEVSSFWINCLYSVYCNILLFSSSVWSEDNLVVGGMLHFKYLLVCSLTVFVIDESIFEFGTAIHAFNSLEAHFLMNYVDVGLSM